jgi:hypothetical protein
MRGMRFLCSLLGFGLGAGFGFIFGVVFDCGLGLGDLVIAWIADSCVSCRSTASGDVSNPRCSAFRGLLTFGKVPMFISLLGRVSELNESDCALIFIVLPQS